MSNRVDIEDAVRLVSVVNQRTGASYPVTISQSPTYSYGNRERWHLDVTGDFEYRVPLELRIKEGLACDRRDEAQPSGGGERVEYIDYPLAEDYVHVFTRSDERPFVSFESAGRYLAPHGERLVAFESMNNSNVCAKISRVPAANIVELLALEEGAYDKIYAVRWDAEGFVGDLSSVASTREFNMSNELNKVERHVLSVGDGNGVYFVELGGEQGGCDRKTVCVSDLGLTVRTHGRGATAWVVSLTGGRPVAGAKVEAYSTSNTLVAKGVTDAQGLAELEAPVGSEKIFAVVATAPDGEDMSFVALREKAGKEDDLDGRHRREGFLGEGEEAAYAWTDRGIYRHGEKIFYCAVLRDGAGRAPSAMPLELLLKQPDGTVRDRKRIMTDEDGIVRCDAFCVDAALPGGTWTIALVPPGAVGKALASMQVKIEEFAPPHIRVKAKAAQGVAPEEFSFTASAEHLYGAPGAGLACKGAVSFEDRDFAPGGEWEGWRFGNADKKALAEFRRLEGGELDARGEMVFKAPFAASVESGPRAAVLAKVSATVFEDGGRPAYAIDAATLHWYDRYIGVKTPDTVRSLPGAPAIVQVAAVKPSGETASAGGERILHATLERVDCIYSYIEEDGGATWKCDKKRTVVASGIDVGLSGDGRGELTLPVLSCGDYVLTVSGGEGDASVACAFYAVEDAGDDFVRAPLSTPGKIVLTPDKDFYRPGETPVLAVRAPFAGTALVTAMREGVEYRRVVALETPTAQIPLDPVTAAQAPNIDVSVEVVQSVLAAGRGRMCAKAYGATTVSIRPPEREIHVSVDASFANGAVEVEIEAPGADAATIVLVDGAIDTLAPGRQPAPESHFAKPRIGRVACYDLFNRLLPLQDESALRANGVKTGGGDDGLMGRISPVPTRRFKPLAKWIGRVELKDSKARVKFDVGEFAGEARISAVAYSPCAVGSRTVACKVAPKLVFQPDAPRFAAPGDRFEVTLPLANTTAEQCEAVYRVSPAIAEGKVALAPGERKILRFAAVAPETPGEMDIRYEASAFGESHEDVVKLPVRPAVPWRECAGTVALAPGESFALPQSNASDRIEYSVSGTKMEELRSALEWLAGYPHGCLEQTVSRIYPLVAAGGILETLGSVEAANRAEYVAAGVKRVESMWHDDWYAGHFSMWPDSAEDVWDKEVAVYAAMFLADATKGRGAARLPGSMKEMLRNYSQSTNDCLAAYACDALAVAGKPELDMMFRLFAKRETLGELELARLARAFALAGDRMRARMLLADVKSASPSLKTAAAALLAILDTDADDPRKESLVLAIESMRSKEDMTWGTTADNAAALVALGEYWRRNGVKSGKPMVENRSGTLFNAGEGTAFVTWRRRYLPSRGEALKEVSDGIAVKREYLDAAGNPIDLKSAKCGSLAIARITVSTDRDRVLSDLVVDDPFPGGLEPVTGASAAASTREHPRGWVIHDETRDDRKLLYSAKTNLKKGGCLVYEYPLRVVSAGDFAIPQVAVEAMYDTGLRARACGGRIVCGR